MTTQKSSRARTLAAKPPALAILGVLAVLLLIQSGCLHTAAPSLIDRFGWRVESLNNDEYRVFAVRNENVSEEFAQHWALAVAAEISLRAGCKTFKLITDPEHVTDGSEFESRRDYLGGQGMTTWKIGQTFRFVCSKKSAEPGDGVDALTWMRSYEKASRKQKLP